MKTKLNRYKEIDQLLSHYSPSEWNRITQAFMLIGAKYIMTNYDVSSMTISQIEEIAFGQLPEEVSSHRGIKNYQSMSDLYVIQ